MKIAIFSDIHNNETRLKEALKKTKEVGISLCICCGDISSLKVVDQLAGAFKKVYIALGNMDVPLKGKTEAFSDNVWVSDDVLEVEIGGLKLAAVHHDYKARRLAKAGQYDFVFYGHTHTPWEKKIGRTVILNPGEISGQFGTASFAVFDTKKQRAELFLLK